MSAQITGTTGTFTQPILKAGNDGQSTSLAGDQSAINILTGLPIGPNAIGLGVGNMNLDSQLGIYTDKNGYQELNSFLQFWCASTGQDGRSALTQIQLMVNDMLRNPEMRRAYLP